MAKSALKYTIPFQVRIPYDLHEKAKAKSERTGTTLSHVVRKALEKWVEEE